jgi:hypothetical protein
VIFTDARGKEIAEPDIFNIPGVSPIGDADGEARFADKLDDSARMFRNNDFKDTPDGPFTDTTVASTRKSPVVDVPGGYQVTNGDVVRQTSSSRYPSDPDPVNSYFGFSVSGNTYAIVSQPTPGESITIKIFTAGF